MRRILDATRACIDRNGPDIGIVNVARELGVTRQTVYRYFRTTEDLLIATALDASAGFLDRVEAHLAKREWTPDGAVVEGVAFTLEQLPHEPYVGLLLSPGRASALSRGLTSEVALTLGRSIIDRFPVDWTSYGYTSGELDGLVEQMLRMTQSFILDPGANPRRGKWLRAYLQRWLGTAVLNSPGPQSADRHALDTRRRSAPNRSI